jgi:hypothetical protein
MEVNWNRSEPRFLIPNIEAIKERNKSWLLRPLNQKSESR